MSVVSRITERVLQETVEQCARVLGWMVYHPRLSIGSASGYPDLTLAKPGVHGRAPGRLLFVELKSDVGKLSAPQAQWGAVLASIGPPVEYHVWYPADWHSGEIDRILR